MKGSINLKGGCGCVNKNINKKGGGKIKPNRWVEMSPKMTN